MKVKDCKDNLDMILAIEGDGLIVESEEDLEKVLELCRELMYSQGFYGRLYKAIQEKIVDGIEYPITL